MSNSSVKIAILCLPGLQSFLKDIVEHLNRKYDVLTCFDGDPQKISSVVNWADIVWIEWANELAVGLTNNPALLNEKYVICRLHRYEAFVDDFCLKIDWSRIDTLVFVGAFMESMLKARVKDLDQRVGRITTFPNGIDLDKMSFKDRKNGYDLAYVGYINYNKGPMLLLQAFKTLVQADDRYKLHIAGKIQNMHLDYYFTHMVDELNLTENIQFDGWIKDVNLWLQDKQYLVSSSVHESQGVGIMEAMACGIKPVIHNFVGASSIYPEKFIWNTIPEFVDHITKEAYDSAEYRKFVARRYSLVEQMQQIDELIAGIVKKNMSPVIVTDQERSGSALLESETVTENQDSGNPQGPPPTDKGHPRKMHQTRNACIGHGVQKRSDLPIHG
jgi:glycosyltransferase involved in cell wall biosynthesis